MVIDNVGNPDQLPEVVFPLEPGDRLSRDEFERRYAAMPHVKKAELIEGVVFMPAAVRFQQHAQPHSHLITWLGTYQAGTPGVMSADNVSNRLDLDNEPQPDAALFIDPAVGGQVRITDDDYLEGAPELVGEISSSSTSYDLGKKRDVYRRNRVCEYVVWRVLEKELDWFVLRGSEYQTLIPDEQGLLKSEQFPGLWLDTAAMIAGDLARVLDVLRDGMQSHAHSAFVARLQGA